MLNTKKKKKALDFVVKSYNVISRSAKILGGRNVARKNRTGAVFGQGVEENKCRSNNLMGSSATFFC